jgi:hypothetical protein
VAGAVVSGAAVDSSGTGADVGVVGRGAGRAAGTAAGAGAVDGTAVGLGLGRGLTVAVAAGGRGGRPSAAAVAISGANPPTTAK